MKNSSIVSAQWLKDHLSDPDLILLDATIPRAGGKNVGELLEIQIPGTRFFDLKGAFMDKSSPLPNTIPSAEAFTEACKALGINHDSTLVVYDKWGIYSSPRAWWLLRQMGHPNVCVLDGGLPAWLAADFATEAVSRRQYEQGNFVANFDASAVRTADDMLANIKEAQAKVLDARSYGRFKATAPEPRADLIGGHIPGSQSLAFTEVLREGKFLPDEELATVFAKLDLGDTPLIFSCGSGITACIILLAAERVLENETALYDGSWSEWGLPDKGLPIEQ
ncbi:MAG: sulfurtransferase [Bacteroidota bacterium]